MKKRIPALLLDENISHQTATFLISLGYNVKTAVELGLGGTDDETIFRVATKTKRVIVTLDLDFGEIFYFATTGTVGVIVLRIKDQSVETVNGVLANFLQSNISRGVDLRKSLIIAEDGGKIRVRRK